MSRHPKIHPPLPFKFGQVLSAVAEGGAKGKEPARKLAKKHLKDSKAKKKK
jgi:hypothetical protein